MDLSGILKVVFLAISWVSSSAQILDVRLQDGDSPTSGRVEINVEGVGWNSICGSSWDISDVTVTCRQLGFTGAQLEVVRFEFGSGTAPIYKKTIHCKGKEANLDDCQLLTTPCGSSIPAGAVCHGPSYLGCYGDSPLNRLFTGTSYTDNTGMTTGDCISFCKLRDFEYAGLELGSECYCGNAETDYTRLGLFSDKNCRHACSGNSLETCGGIAKMAVHRTATPTSVTMATTTQATSARTPNLIERTTGSAPTMMPTSLMTSSEGQEPTKDSQEVKGAMTDETMMMIVYILGALLFFCLVLILGCLIWNCKLRSRNSFNVSTAEHDTTPVRDQSMNALPYMSLSERRPDDNGYQSLSVQRKEAERGPMPEDPYATSLGEPVYQEPGVYLEPDNVCSVSYKPGDPVTDDLFLGGGNEYETLGV